jgi:hypothetical protein
MPKMREQFSAAFGAFSRQREKGEEESALDVSAGGTVAAPRNDRVAHGPGD